MLENLATVLNGLGSGATKSPEKWWKCWQDWRSDVKAKALKISKYSSGTGGGPGPSPLTKLEETLLQFCGVEMVQGVDGVGDPLELSQIPEAVAVDVEVTATDEDVPATELKEVPTSERSRKGKNDQLQASLDRQAAAIESMSAGILSMNSSLQSGMSDIAAALREVAAAIAQQPRILIEKSDEV